MKYIRAIKWLTEISYLILYRPYHEKPYITTTRSHLFLTWQSNAPLSCLELYHLYINLGAIRNVMLKVVNDQMSINITIQLL